MASYWNSWAFWIVGAPSSANFLAEPGSSSSSDISVYVFDLSFGIISPSFLTFSKYFAFSSFVFNYEESGADSENKSSCPAWAGACSFYVVSSVVVCYCAVYSVYAAAATAAYCWASFYAAAAISATYYSVNYSFYVVSAATGAYF